MGFDRVAAAMDDLKLDLPAAPQRFEQYRAQAEAACWLQSQPPAADEQHDPVVASAAGGNGAVSHGNGAPAAMAPASVS